MTQQQAPATTCGMTEQQILTAAIAVVVDDTRAWQGDPLLTALDCIEFVRQSGTVEQVDGLFAPGRPDVSPVLRESYRLVLQASDRDVLAALLAGVDAGWFAGLR